MNLGFLELAVVVRVELGQRFLLQGFDRRAVSLAREGASAACRSLESKRPL